MKCSGALNLGLNIRIIKYPISDFMVVKLRGLLTWVTVDEILCCIYKLQVGHG